MKYNLVKVREGKVEDLPNVFNLIKELAKYENALNKIKTNVKTLEKDGYGENPQFKIFVAEYDFKIIEDACHAIGGSCNNYPVGSCKYSDITVFSLHPVKIITSAEGGIDIEEVAKKTPEKITTVKISLANLINDEDIKRIIHPFNLPEKTKTTAKNLIKSMFV